MAANRIAALRSTGSKTATAKTETVTLADVIANPETVNVLSRMLGGTATAKDVADLAGLARADLAARLRDVAKVSAAMAKSLDDGEVRVSTKDGSKAYVYAVAKCETGAATIGLTLSDAVGEVLAKFARRG